jgi:hypothetical protein
MVKDDPPHKPNLDPSTPRDAQEIINHIKSLQADLEQKLDVVYQKSKLTPKKVKDLLSNPNAFSPKDWEKLQEKKRELEKSLGFKLGTSIKKEKVKIEIEEKDRARKGKTLGARKKWMPMR